MSYEAGSYGADQRRDPPLTYSYAVIGHGRGIFGPSEGFTITWVPCTPRVLAAVAEDSR